MALLLLHCTVRAKIIWMAALHMPQQLTIDHHPSPHKTTEGKVRRKTACCAVLACPGATPAWFVLRIQIVWMGATFSTASWKISDAFIKELHQLPEKLLNVRLVTRKSSWMATETKTPVAGTQIGTKNLPSKRWHCSPVPSARPEYKMYPVHHCRLVPLYL